MKSVGDASVRGATAVAIAIAVALVVGVFGRVLTHPFIAFDDVELILRNPQVTTPFVSLRDQLLTPRVGYIVPVTVGVEAVLFAISSGQAWSFHGAALLLHAALVAQLLLAARRFGTSVPVALGAVLLFALHPLVAQPVAWANCLKDLLMANFAWAATACWLDVAERDAPRSRAWTAVSLAALAMSSKPSAVLLGFAWLAALVARRMRGTASSVRAWHAAVATAAMGVGVGFASRVAHDAVMGVERAWTWTSALPLAVLGRQLRHVVWPDALAILYGPPRDGFANPDVWVGLAAVVVVAIGLFVARARHRVVLLGGLGVLVYLPTSNVLPFARVMSDSYMYLPLALISLLAALGAEHVLRGASVGARRVVAGVVVVLVGWSAGVTYAEVGRWRGGDALWAPVVAANPRHAQAHRLRGDELLLRGMPERAVASYRRAFELEYDPRYLVEFGSLLAMAGRLEDAECVLAEAFAFGTDPAEAAFNHAVLLAFHPEYRPREPAVARAMLERLDQWLASGRLRWPDALAPGLAAQRARLADAAHGAKPSPWRRRTCAMLRAE